jgi:hypothetical protein
MARDPFTPFENEALLKKLELASAKALVPAGPRTVNPDPMGRAPRVAPPEPPAWRPTADDIKRAQAHTNARMAPLPGGTGAPPAAQGMARRGGSALLRGAGKVAPVAALGYGAYEASQTPDADREAFVRSVGLDDAGNSGRSIKRATGRALHDFYKVADSATLGIPSAISEAIYGRKPTDVPPQAPRGPLFDQQTDGSGAPGSQLKAPRTTGHLAPVDSGPPTEAAQRKAGLSSSLGAMSKEDLAAAGLHKVRWKGEDRYYDAMGNRADKQDVTVSNADPSAFTGGAGLRRRGESMKAYENRLDAGGGDPQVRAYFASLNGASEVLPHEAVAQGRSSLSTQERIARENGPKFTPEQAKQFAEARLTAAQADDVAAERDTKNAGLDIKRAAAEIAGEGARRDEDRYTREVAASNDAALQERAKVVGLEQALIERAGDPLFAPQFSNLARGAYNDARSELAALLNDYDFSSIPLEGGALTTFGQQKFLSPEEIAQLGPEMLKFEGPSGAMQLADYADWADLFNTGGTLEYTGPQANSALARRVALSGDEAERAKRLLQLLQKPKQ